MIIAQITDLHVVGDGQLCLGRIPTNERLRAAVAHINGLQPRPDLVFATGDLAEHGLSEEYDALRAILADLRPPLYLIPGNHDKRDVFLDAFADHAYLPRQGAPFAHFVLEEYPVRLIGLDTLVPGKAHGLICDERLAWLDAVLGEAPGRPTMIFMHHPPFRTGIRWIDALGLHGGRKLEAVVERHPQVERIACGHVHRPIQVGWGGTVAATAPSTSQAELALALSEADGYDFGYVMEPQAVQLYVRDPGYGFLSHLSYVSGAYESFSTGKSERTNEVFRSRYQEFCLAEFDAAQPPRS